MLLYGRESADAGLPYEAPCFDGAVLGYATGSGDAVWPQAAAGGPTPDLSILTDDLAMGLTSPLCSSPVGSVSATACRDDRWPGAHMPAQASPLADFDDDFDDEDDDEDEDDDFDDDSDDEDPDDDVDREPG